jgi:hypothetical protein
MCEPRTHPDLAHGREAVLVRAGHSSRDRRRDRLLPLDGVQSLDIATRAQVSPKVRVRASSNSMARSKGCCTVNGLEQATQAEIAAEIGYSRSMVSRLLDEARQHGLDMFAISHECLTDVNLCSRSAVKTGSEATILALLLRMNSQFTSVRHS